MNFLITNPQSPYTRCCQSAIAERVVLGSMEVRVAVDLDGEPVRRAIEIDYVSGDYLLSPEMERTKRVVSERTPQDFLLRRHPPAEIFCEFQLLASHNWFRVTFTSPPTFSRFHSPHP